MLHDPAFHPHDHSACREAVMEGARRLAEDEGLRLTPIRLRVLEILAESHRPLGAYDVLERLAGEGHPRQPPIAYRALDFLCANGLAHRINRLNAFAACRAPGQAHVPSFLICRECGRVAEATAPAVLRAVERMAGDEGFVPDPVGVEALGLCPRCAAGAAGTEAQPEARPEARPGSGA